MLSEGNEILSRSLKYYHEQGWIKKGTCTWVGKPKEAQWVLRGGKARTWKGMKVPDHVGPCSSC